MKKGLRRLSRSPTFRAVLVLSSGTISAQVANLLAAPVLSRLYSPSDFGVLATYISLSAFLILASTGAYEYAVVLPDDDRRAGSVAAVGLLCVLLVSGLTATIALLLWIVSTQSLSTPSVGVLLVTMPITVLVGGTVAIFTGWALRAGDFRKIAFTTTTRQFVAISVQVGFGLVKPSPIGLVLGALLGYGSASLRLGRTLIRDLVKERRTVPELTQSAKEFVRFPRSSMPSSLMNAGFVQGTPLVIGVLFGASVLGVWFMTQRLLTLPAALVGRAVSQAYFRRANEVRGSSAQSRLLFDRAVLHLAAISIAPFTIIGLVSPWLFSTLLGPAWTDAGVYARIMLPMVWLRFVASPTETTNMVAGRNSLSLLTKGSQLAALILVAVGTQLLELSFIQFLSVLSLTISVLLVMTILLNRWAVSNGRFATEEPSSTGLDTDASG